MQFRTGKWGLISPAARKALDYHLHHLHLHSDSFRIWLRGILECIIHTHFHCRPILKHGVPGQTCSHSCKWLKVAEACRTRLASASIFLPCVNSQTSLQLVPFPACFRQRWDLEIRPQRKKVFHSITQIYVKTNVLNARLTHWVLYMTAWQWMEIFYFSLQSFCSS